MPRSNAVAREARTFAYVPLSDISENPNNDRIDGDPPTHPPNPNKCLMLDVMYIVRYTQPLLFMECGCFEKGFFRPSFPKQSSLHLETNTVAFSLHT